MQKIRAFVLKNLLAVSAILTAWQVKMVNAQMAYMGPPTPHGPTLTPIPTSTPGSGDSMTIWVVATVVFLLALIGLIIVAKYLVGLIIRLFRKK